MTALRRRLAVTLAGVTVAAAALAGCSGDDDAAPKTTAGERSTRAGGTLTTLSLGPVLTWDPQRIATRDDMAFAVRIFARTLTAYAPGTSADEQSRLVGDLATDTGTPNDDFTQWRFTLREGAKWQDGTSVTCADLAYGISRTFATSVISGGSTDALAVLDVPRGLDGSSTYRGPYDTSKANAAGQQAFSKAVSCTGSTITFHLSAPTADFNEMLTLPAFSPIKKAKDKGKDGTYAVFSAGPYTLEGDWKPAHGGTWVRNPHWEAKSDPVRSAYPDRIDFREGVQPQSVAQSVIEDRDSGATSVALTSAPPSLHQELTGILALKDRTLNPATGVVDYLVPNVSRAPMKNEHVRVALATATNRLAYVTALGGPSTGDPTFSVLASALPAAHTDDPVGAGLRGDPDAARAILTKAKVSLPVKITVAYRSSEAATKAMAGLVAGWREAGFAPILRPIADNYFTAISDPALKSQVDVFWSNWSAAWASASTVLPPLFDSSINLTAAGPGRDYGWYADDLMNSRMSKISRIADRAEREQAWSAVDIALLQQGIYIGLSERRGLYVAGSGVRNLAGNEVLGGVVELADIAVAP